MLKKLIRAAWSIVFLLLAVLKGNGQTLSISGPIKVDGASIQCYGAFTTCTTHSFCWTVTGASSYVANTGCGLNLAAKSSSSVATPNTLPGGGGCVSGAGITVTFPAVSSVTLASVTVNGACSLVKSVTVTIVPPIQTVTLSPASQTVTCGGTVTTLSPGTISGGDGTYTYSWQSSPDNSTWTPISGATSATYTPPAVSTGVMYYRLQVSSFDYTKISGSVSVTTVAPALSAGVLTPAIQAINYNTAPSTLSGTPASGGSCSAVTYGYLWQQSTDNVSWSTASGTSSGQNYSPSNLLQTTYFRRQDSYNGQTVVSNTVKVKVNLQSGTISPASQTIAYKTAPSTLTISAAGGGNGTYLYRWLSSPTLNGFYAPTGTTGSSYTPRPLSDTTYYTVAIISDGDSILSPSPVVVNVIQPAQVNPMLSPGTITPSAATITSGTSPGTLTANPATGGDCSGSYSYQWQQSTDGINFSTTGVTSQNYNPGNLSTTTYYRRQAVCFTDTAYTNIAVITVGTLPVAADFSYTRTRYITRPGITDTASAGQLSDPNDVKQTTQYFDALGRPVQTVDKQASPLGNDLVSPVMYDGFGRASVKWLPYAAPSQDGNYKPGFLAEQSSFNTAQFPGEQFLYGQTDYEPSSLARPLASLAPGNSWVGSSRETSGRYLLNTAADSVRYWSIGFAPGSIPSTAAAFGPGQLFKMVSTDEAGHQQVAYKNMLGQVILKKTQLSGTPATGHSGWLCTYYVYDDLGNLRFVLQPRAVELINGSWSISQSVADEFCFRYEYDARHRPVIQKGPGIAEAWAVYDARDRVVMSQDSALRAQNKWMVAEYDAQDRPSRTGLLTDGNNRAYHQALAYASIAYPNTAANYEVVAQKYYDDYTWVAGSGTSLGNALDATNTGNSSYFITGYNTSPSYALPVAQSSQTRGMVTGIKTKVIGTTASYLYVANFYDDHGRVIQAQSINLTGAKDIVTTQYDFNGKTLRSFAQHQKNGTNAQSHTLLTKLDYDAAGRLIRSWNNIDNAPADQLMASLGYNELGLLAKKTFGNNIDSLAYDYNIRGWVTGINKNYISGSATNYFGMELGYDKTASAAGTTSYRTPLYNGNITGTVWKSRGDGVARKYDFTYDTTGRLTSAGFLQNTQGASWDNATIDFSVSNLSYDANGNILTMSQKGFTLGSSSLIDSLTYTYLNGNASNKLAGVVDAVNDTTAKLGDFKYNPATKQTTDYSYDGNGNMVADNNRAIDNIVYNYMNLPQLVHMKGKGTVQYVYDATGHKLQKIVTDSIVNKITTTTFIGSFVYQSSASFTGSGSDTLQFIGLGDERARWAFHRFVNGTTGYGFEYDFFEKDHLENTRVVLTQQKDTAQYIATMESAYRSTETGLFYNIPESSYPSSAVPGYPSDNTTNPNDSLARVNGSGQKMGPAIILKVMAGDTIDIAAKSFYTSQTGTGTNPSIMDVLNSLAGGIVNMTAGGKGSLAQLSSTGGPLYGALSSFMAANNPSGTGQLRAYLNWVLLDDQLKYVNTFPQSGAIPITNFAAGSLGTPGQSGIPITKSGYLYIYVNNETQGWDAFFDNLSIRHRSGPLLEETHYYPFGLTMAAISDKAQKTNYSENKYRFNSGSELQNKEFSDGSGLELYETSWRNYDPQIGIFHQYDPLAAQGADYSPYAYCINNPVSYADPFGTHYMAQQPWNAQSEINESNEAMLGGSSWFTGGPGADWVEKGPGGNGEDVQGATVFSASTPGKEGSPAAAYVALLKASGLTPSPNDPTLVQLVYEATWAGHATDICAEMGPSGVELSFTATSTGNSYANYQATESTITHFLNDLEEKNESFVIAGKVTETVGLTFETTEQGMTHIQELANKFGNTNYNILELSKGASKVIGTSFGVVNMAATVGDGLTNGWKAHHTADLAITSLEIGLSLFEVTNPIGWALGAGMFIGNMLSEHYTGKTLTQNIFDK